MNTSILDNGFVQQIVSYVPSALRVIVLILLALILANVVRKLVVKGLASIKPVSYLSKWGLVKEGTDEAGLNKTIGQVFYFATILFFLPAILSGLGVASVVDPISSMFAEFFGFIPNIIAAGFILFLGFYFCKFIKNLIKNLIINLPIDKWMTKALGQDSNTALTNEAQLADVLSTIVYVLIFVPILATALDTLGVAALSKPIVALLDQVVGFIPNLVTAVLLLVIGGFLAKLIGNLVEKLLETSGINQYSKYLSFDEKKVSYSLSKVIANLVRGILAIFFLVQAIAVLNLEVLNTIGFSIIAFLPAIISSLLILAAAVVGGNILADFFGKVTNNKFLAELVRYGLIVLAVFMTLDQLGIAQTIVQSAFTIILSALAVAFALAFGLGGRDFAAKQLDKLDKTINKDK
ncbi:MULTISPECIES: mechanosensitive ion channel [unclassified Streptococcus]|uniref:mechanosensitive ion channel n=1 Tax=unclassified Streptococcus TaxID=2608887 RepID=UPI0011B4C035|nr:MULTISPECIES: mechanosensitive ion channel [unclassified Streptococcus]TWS95290.1 hypothetical protein FRX52_00355 [Streptococcus sp. sy018]TWT16398.1 hypothetical protein FRX51_00345 [Streptococcus sp. sy010]